MRASILDKVQKINTNLGTLLTELEQYSHEDLNKKPSPAEWSAVQVMQHLILAEGLSVGYCKKKLSFKPKLKKAGFMAKVRTLIAIGYLASPIKVKAPKGVRTVNLPTDTDFTAIAEKWRKQRQELVDYLTTVPEEYLDKAIYKHPVAGRISFGGMLDFFGAHFESHRKQITKALK